MEKPIFLLLAVAACGGRTPGPHREPLPNLLATAALTSRDSVRVGIATFSSSDSGAWLGLSVSGLSPGKHGLHIHETGSCVTPDFESAGGHLNPAGKQHGSENPEGPHAGDLPNLQVEADGSADTSFAIDPALLGEGGGSVFRAQGAALVIHAGPDDLKTDPSGGSGERVACGVIERS
jgi:superoxide dismutase, Cu-Zn family